MAEIKGKQITSSVMYAESVSLARTKPNNSTWKDMSWNEGGFH